MKKFLALSMAALMAVAMLAGCATSAPAETAEYVILDEDFGSEEYGVGFRNEDIAFAAAVQAALDEMNEDGTAAEISETWFGEDIVMKDAKWVEGELIPAADDNSLQYIKDKGNMIVGLDDSFPPMGFRDEKGEIAGFDIDLAKAVGEKLGVEVVFQPIDWNAKELELSQKRIDMIWNGMTITDERIETMCFGKPYIANRQVVITSADSGITDLKGLAGKKVGVQRGSSAVEAINSKPEIAETFGELVEFDQNLNAFLDLKSGRVDAVVMDVIVGRYIITTDSANEAK
jgi:ABC-type amino acid transport substrate-binding protein